MEILSARINNAIDLAHVRMELRKCLLHDLKCSPAVMVRSIIAITAMGEFIIASQQRDAVTITCIVINHQEGSYLQYSCQVDSEFSKNSMAQRAIFNFKRVMDKDVLDDETAKGYILSGLQRLACVA